ncbi:MFS transporter [Flavivirga spongiicola]|uniref:MFS transporter n=1 Tax=Flavivirga spongiicola TaxID=421621 RepID=A0ABU7XTH0_9FLAO|nr:MFS transporter [Flavivirga sp. MEBiC05379]MDO5978724.1 MFS transporter [Flavivirga sp. MEBiC05379]
MQNISHSKPALIYAIAYSFERASYYGIRTIIVLYMVGETLQMSNQEAVATYGWFSLFIVFSNVLGALLGDLLVGNKKGILVGGTLQTLGCFILCIQSLGSLYIGFGLIILGSGLFTSNTIAQFGKQYLINNPKLLDAGFTLFHLAISIGSFIGVVVTGYMAESNFNYGFIVTGVLTMLATVFILFTNNNQGISSSNYKNINIDKRLLYIITVIITSGIFLMVYESTYFDVYTIQEKVFDGIDVIPEVYLKTGLGSFFGIIIISILTLVWTYVYTNSFFKIFLGLIVSALSFIILLFIPETPNSLSLTIFIFSAFLLSAGEMLISPILYSVTTKFSNPKYLAIILSLITIPSMLFNKISGIITEYSNEISYNTIFLISVFILLVFGVIAYGLSLLYKKDDRIHLSKEADEFLS